MLSGLQLREKSIKTNIVAFLDTFVHKTTREMRTLGCYAATTHYGKWPLPVIVNNKTLIRLRQTDDEIFTDNHNYDFIK